jgi:hypothetical protein
VKRSFLGRLDIYTQRLSEWLGAFPRWHGGTWANPPVALDGKFVEWTGGVMDEARESPLTADLVQESERGFGYHGASLTERENQLTRQSNKALANILDVCFPVETPHGDEPGEKLNTFGPGVDPEVSQDAVTATALIPSEHVKAMRQTGKRIMDTITNIREVQEAAQIREATEGPVFRSDANLKEIAEERKGDGYAASVVVPELLKQIDPRIIEADRQENLPPHAKNLGQKVAKLPPGRGKGQPRKEPRSNTRTTSQWRGRYCDECGRHSGGPRSTKCQHCIEPFA